MVEGAGPGVVGVGGVGGRGRAGVVVQGGGEEGGGGGGGGGADEEGGRDGRDGDEGGDGSGDGDGDGLGCWRAVARSGAAGEKGRWGGGRVAACGWVEEWRKHENGSGDGDAGDAGACEERGGTHGGET